MSSINRYINLKLKFGSKFDEINLPHPSIIKVLNDVDGLGVNDGDRYIIGSNPIGDLRNASANDIAEYEAGIGTWVFFTPFIGLEVIDRNEKSLKRFNGDEWITILTFISPAGVLDSDISGNAGSADKLKNARMFSITGAAEADEVAFDGTQKVILTLKNLDMASVTKNILGMMYGGTGRNDGKTVGLASPINFQLTGGVSGLTQSRVDLTSDVVINVASINASKIDTGTLPVSRGGTGCNILSGLLKGNGLNPVVSATPGVDYVTPTGSVEYANLSGNFLNKKKISLSKAVTGETTTNFSTDTNIEVTDLDANYLLHGTIPVNRLTGKYDINISGKADIPNESPGVFKWYCGSVAPDGYLECNGQAVSRETYSNLFSIIGSTYGNGDGSTTFNVPDVRGYAIRGWDHEAGIDTGRVLGSKQQDVIKSHSHYISLESTKQGSHSHIITIDNADTTHNHSITIGTGGSHVHSADAANNGNHNHSYWDVYYSEFASMCPDKQYTSIPGNIGQRDGSDYDNVGYQMSRGTGYAGLHSHTITIKAGGDHTHSSSSSNSVGVGASHTHTATSNIVGEHKHTVTGSSNNTGESETRMKNIAFMGIIKY